MPIFLCEICNSYEIASHTFPSFCEGCGAMNGPWKLKADGIVRFLLAAEKGKMLVYREKEVSRDDIRTFFPDLKDQKGNHIFKYCDNAVPVFKFVKNNDGVFGIITEHDTKNEFYLNSTRIDCSYKKLKFGDYIQVYSTTQMKFIAVFTVQKE